MSRVFSCSLDCHIDPIRYLAARGRHGIDIALTPEPVRNGKARALAAAPTETATLHPVRVAQDAPRVSTSRRDGVELQYTLRKTGSRTVTGFQFSMTARTNDGTSRDDLFAATHLCTKHG